MTFSRQPGENFIAEFINSIMSHSLNPSHSKPQQIQIQDQIQRLDQQITTFIQYSENLKIAQEAISSLDSSDQSIVKCGPVFIYKSNESTLEDISQKVSSTALHLERIQTAREQLTQSLSLQSSSSS